MIMSQERTGLLFALHSLVGQEERWEWGTTCIVPVMCYIVVMSFLHVVCPVFGDLWVSRYSGNCKEKTVLGTASSKVLLLFDVWQKKKLKAVFQKSFYQC